MNNEIKEIKLEKRKPTFDYILNDLAFDSLMFRVVNSIGSSQDKFDFDYQVKLMQKEIPRLRKYQGKIDKAIEYVNTHKVSDTITFPLMKKEQERDVKNCFDYEFEQIYKKDLLNILDGDDND